MKLEISSEVEKANTVSILRSRRDAFAFAEAPSVERVRLRLPIECRPQAPLSGFLSLGVGDLLGKRLGQYAFQVIGAEGASLKQMHYPSAELFSAGVAVRRAQLTSSIVKTSG